MFWRKKSTSVIPLPEIPLDPPDPNERYIVTCQSDQVNSVIWTGIPTLEIARENASRELKRWVTDWHKYGTGNRPVITIWKAVEVCEERVKGVDGPAPKKSKKRI